MPNYGKAKIYQVISPNHPLPYIGSTTQTLCARMNKHRCYKDTSCRIIIDAGDAYIELIEEFPCDNKEQLNKREGEVIRDRECVNRRVAGRTEREWKRDIGYEKQYYDSHREQQKAKSKAYRDANKEAIKERRLKKKAQQSVECSTITQGENGLTS